MTFVLGLTGSIGMGKSATAAMFGALGVPVHDADAAVHALYRGRAAPLIAAAFPGTVADGVVDRVLLGARVVGVSGELKRLEGIVHPLVRAEEERFLAVVSARRAPFALLDIPLLLESGSQRRCDAVVVVSASAEIQAERVMARPGMTQDRFAALLAKQMPDAEKRRQAHFVVDTGHGFAAARRQVADILRALAGRPGRSSSRPADAVSGGLP